MVEVFELVIAAASADEGSVAVCELPEIGVAEC